jgi:hypothetical protein
MKPSMTKSLSSVTTVLSNIDALSADERNLPCHNQSPHARLRAAAAGYLQITYNSTGRPFVCSIDDIRQLFHPALDRL